MANNLKAEVSVVINSPVSEVWAAITSPEMIKQYLFGTEVTSEWKVGNVIEYKGEYNGKAYHDKGVIKKIVPEQIFESTYWSSMSGKEDKPENYNLVTYKLQSQDSNTELTLIQDNIATEAERGHSSQNWKMVLEKLKALLEKE